ncbi:MAG: xylulokinase [Clostridiales bacterium]|nr:xylulokinase [Clostridiales bacterium]
MGYYLGIDLGTSSTKSLLMLADGLILGSAQEGYDFSQPALGYAEQDPEVLWLAVRRTVQQLTADYPKEMAQLKGIGYSGQMHGLVMLDADNRPLSNIIIWPDIRSTQEIAEIYQTVPWDEYNRIILNPLCTGYQVSSLAWVRKHRPELYARTAKIVFPKDYIRYLMTGNIGVESSDASGGALFDTSRRQWSWELIDRLGFRRDIFPECHESYELAGLITEECAALTGLRAGVRVAFGGGDTIMQQVGNGMVSDNGVWVSNIGTSNQLSCAVSRPVYDTQYRSNTFCHVHEKLWMMMGANVTGGLAQKWLKEKVLHMQDYRDWDREASQVPPGSDGLLFLPYLSGARCPHNDANAKGIYFGLQLGHTRAHLIRSNMEGIIFSLMDCYRVFQSCGMEPDRLLASGGGARSELMLHIQADMYNREIYTNLGKEQSCIGAAVAAAVCAGEYRDYEEACAQIVRYSDTVIKPDKENHKVYLERFEVYRQLYDHTKDLLS